MTRAYVPLPGTIPDKVVAFLSTQPAGAEWATRPLTEAIGADISGGLSNYMESALRAGAVKNRPHPDDQRMLLWSLGDQVPVARPVGGQGAAVDALAEVLAPASKPARKSAGKSPQKTPAAGQPMPGAVVAMPARAMRMAVWSTGELVIELADEVLSFSCAETQALAKYLADHSVQIWGGA